MFCRGRTSPSSVACRRELMRSFFCLEFLTPSGPDLVSRPVRGRRRRRRRRQAAPADRSLTNALIVVLAGRFDERDLKVVGNVAVGTEERATDEGVVLPVVEWAKRSCSRWRTLRRSRWSRRWPRLRDTAVDCVVRSMVVEAGRRVVDRTLGCAETVLVGVGFTVGGAADDAAPDRIRGCGGGLCFRKRGSDGRGRPRREHPIAASGPTAAAVTANLTEKAFEPGISLGW